MENVKETIANLPKDDGWNAGYPLYQYQGFWCSPNFIEDIILSQEGFKAEPTDIFVCSAPKSGTTWLKALAFAIVTRTRYDTSTSPLLSKASHDCIPTLSNSGKKLDICEPGLPLIGTHTPYHALPKSVLNSDCKVVYICREPKDAFVSLYHFLAKRAPNKDDYLSLEKAFDLFCEGKSFYGPYLDHVLGFWKASQEKPHKVLFLKYEEMMKDTEPYVMKLAEFMGYPISREEEEAGAVWEIVRLCSFENLSNLDVNKTGVKQQSKAKVENNFYFRKGKVGDWKNYLTTEMAERLDKLMDQTFAGTRFSFHD
ncbi:hypothetical protein J1N35_017661 [Gossypium stocksii]|uniref:Sulfotransferase n=1 Tax=Gossypium stocksii TaxID=47602 RepID=A0A9D3VMT2_9ROSI|nr:hypothetical protein J1N35_017661 [Gossypium stocksii]